MKRAAINLAAFGGVVGGVAAVVIGSLASRTFNAATVIVCGFVVFLAWLLLIVLPKTKPS